MVTKPFFCRISSPTIFVKGVVKKKAKNDTGKKKQQSSLTTMMFFIKKVPQVRRHQWVRPKKILPTPPWISITTHFSAQAEVPQLRSGLVPHDLEIFETVFRPLPRLGS